jgi:methylated-DNA-[protein]-cysteine S-methyltransferase
MFYSHLQTHTPIGTVTLAASGKGLSLLSFRAEAPRGAIERESELRPYARQLEEYFRGERTSFDVPLDLNGTQFQKDCWNALIAIPYGATRSYADQARTIGRPGAFRAVGQANHCNPIAIIVPCHRVIGAGGKLTGYGGGLHVKEWLLDLERRGSGLWAVASGQ